MKHSAQSSAAEGSLKKGQKRSHGKMQDSASSKKPTQSLAHSLEKYTNEIAKKEIAKSTPKKLKSLAPSATSTNTSKPTSPSKKKDAMESPMKKPRVVHKQPPPDYQEVVPSLLSQARALRKGLEDAGVEQKSMMQRVLGIVKKQGPNYLKIYSVIKNMATGVADWQTLQMTPMLADDPELGTWKRRLIKQGENIGRWFTACFDANDNMVIGSFEFEDGKPSLKPSQQEEEDEDTDGSEEEEEQEEEKPAPKKKKKTVVKKEEVKTTSKAAKKPAKKSELRGTRLDFIDDEASEASTDHNSSDLLSDSETD